MNATAPLPAPELRALLLPAYAPCRNFGRCREARWDPAGGHAPRGFLGATGGLDAVEAILVFAEPGNPHPGAGHGDGRHPQDTFQSCLDAAYRAFSGGTDRFHRNTRAFLDLVWPGLGFDAQLARVWLTEGRLCSFADELGGRRDATCARDYLRAQLDLLPRAVVVGFGAKAQAYLRALGAAHVGAYALAPPGCDRRAARAGWEAAAAAIRTRRGNPPPA